MRGRIKVGLWLPFTAEQIVDGRSFTLAPPRRTRAVHAAVRHRSLRRRRRQHRGPAARAHRPCFDAHDAETARSAATRAAIESVVFAPPSVLPGFGVAWRAESDEIIVASFDLPPEHPEVRLRIDEHGRDRLADQRLQRRLLIRTRRGAASQRLRAASAPACTPRMRSQRRAASISANSSNTTRSGAQSPSSTDELGAAADQAPTVRRQRGRNGRDVARVLLRVVQINLDDHVGETCAQHDARSIRTTETGAPADRSARAPTPRADVSHTRTSATGREETRADVVCCGIRDAGRVWVGSGSSG